MNAAQIWNNIIAYSLQIGLLVGVGAIVPTLLKLRTPRAKLFYWQALLAACLLLPWAQPWRHEVLTLSNVSLQDVVGARLSAAAPAGVSGSVSLVRHSIPFTTILLYLLGAGVLLRLVLLGAGLARLAGYRRRGQLLAPDPVLHIATGVGVRLLISDEVPSPVTFGWRDPVVLLPARFLSLQPELREGILCHELIHVERNDWLITLAEEFARAVFWFHPAVWWVLGEIQLAREQSVDWAVVDITKARGHYLDALLAMAAPALEGAPEPALDLAPAPLFLRRRHLRQRIAGLLQDAQGSRFSAVRVGFAVAGIVAGCSFVSGAFPLSAPPQIVSDAAGVVVNTGDARLEFRTPVADPGVAGRVEIHARIGADGVPGDDSEVECLQTELCDAVAASLPKWKFDIHQANTIREMSIDFSGPSSGPGPKAASTAALRMQGPTFRASANYLGNSWVAVIPAVAPNAFGHPLSEIRVAGFSDMAAMQLKSRLPVQAGDVWSPAVANMVRKIVKDFDSRFETDVLISSGAQEWNLWIGPGSFFDQPEATAPVLPSGVKLPAILSRYNPEFSTIAKSAGISGVVTLSVIVGPDGTARNIQLMRSLDPRFDRAAAEALSKWRFRPGTKDGVAVSIPAQVNFSFRML